MALKYKRATNEEKREILDSAILLTEYNLPYGARRCDSQLNLELWVKRYSGVLIDDKRSKHRKKPRSKPKK